MENISVLLDTSIAWDYLCYSQNQDKYLARLNILNKRKEDLRNFIKLLDERQPGIHISWFCNGKADHKLKEKYSSKWEAMKGKYSIEMSSIPLTLLDGSHLLDGSIMLGGNSGGEYSFLTTSLKERFDTEHLETANEHNHYCWLTIDYKKTQQLRKRKIGNGITDKMIKMAMTPSELYLELFERAIGQS
ncbi:MAG: hypothetical protein OEZ04_04295 [Nitrospinota bacterium]|nr:hypothetical protein [Nitrospinota bacterium]